MSVRHALQAWRLYAELIGLAGVDVVVDGRFGRRRTIAELCTHPKNARSQRVAERAGFLRAGEVENYARFKDGETTAVRYVWP